MKINNSYINTLSIGKSSESGRAKNFCKTNNDVFLKSPQISFTGAKWSEKQIDDCVNSFTDKLIYQIKNNDFNEDSVSKIIREVAPDFKILVADKEILSELNPELAELDSTLAICSSNYTSEARKDIRSILFISYDRFYSGTKNDKYEFLGNIVHEFRHAMDNNAGKQFFEFQGLKIPRREFNNLSVNLTKEIYNAFNIDDMGTKLTGSINDKTFFNFISIPNQEKFDQAIKEITCSCIDSNISRENKKSVKQIIKALSLICTGETNAYKSECNAVKKCNGIKGNMTLDFMPYLYEKLAEYYKSHPDPYKKPLLNIFRQK